MSIKILLLSFIGLLSCSVSKAAYHPQADSLRISLLTCAPGAAPYEFYGHTAIRVQNSKTNQDLVFNYGIFDFDTPNFTWRFITAQTDYTIGVSHFDSFARAYQRQGRYVVAQVLNLRPDEKARLYAALQADWAQPDWTYRYNIFYDNCTTRAISQITAAVDGKVRFPILENGRRTLRDILHEFAQEKSPWYSFGEDLILGAELDQPADVWKQMFSPVYAEKFMAQTEVMGNDGQRRPLIESTEMAVQAISSEEKAFPVTPKMAMWGLLLIVAGMTYRELKKGCQFRAFDYALMFVQGLVGMLVAFLFFISEHPAVDSNWLIVLLNPLPLICLPVKIWRDRKEKKDFYNPLLGGALVVFALSALLDMQKYPSEFYPLALILLLRVIVSLYFESKRKTKRAIR